MTIDSNKIRWASGSETDPITGLPNKSDIPDEFKTSGTKANQPVPRQWINNQFNEIYNAAVDLQAQVDAIVGGSSQPTLEAVYPVGVVYTSSDPTNPNTVFGFGTWVAVEGFIAGYTAGDPDFGTVLQTGGSKTHSHTDNFTVDGHALTEAEMPAHSHEYDKRTTSINVGSGQSYASGITVESTSLTGGGLSHDHGLSGGVQSESNIPPFKVYFQWERTS